MIKATLRTAPALIGERREFNCNGTLFGRNRAPLSPFGQLPLGYHDEFEIACGASDFYAVYSYRTPIAWYANGSWYVPPVRYSVTTSRHQGRLYMLLGQPGGNTAMAAKRHAC